MYFSKLNPFLRYGSTFLLKSHKSEVVSPDCHLHYVYSGGFTAFVQNKHYHLSENSVYYCPKGTIYRFEVDENHMGDTVLTSLNFDFGHSECTDTQIRTPIIYAENMVISYDPLFEFFRESESFLGDVKVFGSAKKYLPYFNRIIKEFHLQSVFGRDVCSCILRELLILLHAIPKNLPVRESECLKEVVDYIDSNFSNPIDNKKISKTVGYHPNYLGRIFKNYMNMSIHQYILSLRIAEAKNLISGTNLSFQEISEKSGFDNYAYFSAYFKKRTGMSPSQYRQYHINIINP